VPLATCLVYTQYVSKQARPHIVNGEFQSDKYPTCPRGKVPLSLKDVTAQDLLWSYAQRRRLIDAEFADDLETCLRAAGYTEGDALIAEREATQKRLDRIGVFDVSRSSERELLAVIRLLCDVMIAEGLADE
jgi:hypothetical protein